jgi:DNA-binding Lrp family transcriptional regulator
MVLGVAMIKVMPGKERSVYYAIKCKDKVLDIYHIFGEFDLFIILQAEGFGKLNLLIEEFQEINGVIEARTILISRANSLREYEPIKVLA